MEYGMILGMKLESLFDLNSVPELLLLLLMGVGITFVGYLVNGFWGASVALILGVIFFFAYQMVCVKFVSSILN